MWLRSALDTFKPSSLSADALGTYPMVSRPSPTPFERSTTQRSTRMFSPKPGQMKFALSSRWNQLTWKIFGGLVSVLGPSRASERSSRPCCSRRTAAWPSDRGARRRPRRWRPPWSPSHASRREHAVQPVERLDRPAGRLSRAAPPKMIALIGTPSGLPHCGEIRRVCLAAR